jgi:hypothetical protein
MTDRYLYSKQAGELLVTEKNCVLFWRGKPKQLDVNMVLTIQGTDDCIILLDYYQADALQTKNLVRCGPKGNIIWESGFPSVTLYRIKRTNHEVYVFVEFEDTLIVGTSASGFLDYIEIDTGNVIKSVFVK